MKTRISLLVAVLFAFAGPKCFLFGQSTSTSDLANFTYSIDYPSQSLNQGESVTIRLLLGTVSQQVEDVVGFDLELELSEYAQLPNSVDLSMENSWLNTDVSLNDVSSVDDPTRTLHLEVNRSDNSGVTGYGEIVTVTLVSDIDNATPQMLVSSLHGGIMIEDNIEMKTELGEGLFTSELKVFPNPATHFINMEGLEPGSEYKLIDLSGNIVMEGMVSDEAIQALDVQSLSKGLYVLKTPQGITRIAIQ